MKRRRNHVIAAVSVMLCVGLVFATVGTSASQKKTTIVVESLVPGSTPEATATFKQRISQFEAKYPTIHVVPREWQWLPATFAAERAAGTLPDEYHVPFTDARTVGDRGWVADVTKYVKRLPYYKNLNPAAVAEGTTSKGAIVGLPFNVYAMALHYNRHLFAQAGLNPDRPPTTWAQLRAYAKQIHDKTGMTGYAQMGNADNTAGWILTTQTYALGGRMEGKANGTSTKATVSNTYTATALRLLHDMRWTDGSMGPDYNLSWGSANTAFAAGKIGMFINGSDVYTFMVQNAGLDPSIYGLATIPVGKNKTSGVLGGGSIAVCKKGDSDAQLDACVKWISFRYMDVLVNRNAAILDGKTQAANKQPVGVPTFPIFGAKAEAQRIKWLQPWINVPRSQMKPYLDNIFQLQLIPEPSASTQSVYAALNPTVQAVFSDPNANIPSLLATANGAAQQAISSGK